MPRDIIRHEITDNHWTHTQAMKVIKQTLHEEISYSEVTEN